MYSWEVTRNIRVTKAGISVEITEASKFSSQNISAQWNK